MTLKLIPHKFATQAHITAGMLVTDERAAAAFDVDALMAKAREKSKNPKTFDTNPPYFWRDVISSDVIDSYFTRMHKTTLQSFADGATRGVSFQYSHDWEKLGLGWSLLGHFNKLPKPEITDGTEPSMETLTDFFTVPGLKMNDQMATDDFILGVDTGILNDVSVGFFAGAIKCGICGGDMYNGWFGIWGRECNHFPGRTYTDPYIDEKGNAFGGDVLATAWIMDGVLSEVSQVFDGACPGAGHLKAQLWADNNLLDGRDIRDLEAHYRMKLPGGAYVLRVPGLPDGIILDQGVLDAMRMKKNADGTSSIVVDDDAESEATRLAAEAATEAARVAAEAATALAKTGDDDEEDERAMLDDIQSRFSGEGITLADTARATIEQLCEKVVAQRASIQTLTVEAEDGRTYRTDLVAKAKTFGAAALGTKWDEAKYDRVLAALDLDGIKALSETWEEIRNAKFPTSRLTTDGDKLTPPAKPAASTSDRDHQA